MISTDVLCSSGFGYGWGTASIVSGSGRGRAISQSSEPSATYGTAKRVRENVGAALKGLGYPLLLEKKRN